RLLVKNLPNSAREEITVFGIGIVSELLPRKSRRQRLSRSARVVSGNSLGFFLPLGRRFLPSCRRAKNRLHDQGNRARRAQRAPYEHRESHFSHGTSSVGLPRISRAVQASGRAGEEPYSLGLHFSKNARMVS